jgi:hypothetical protein
MSQHQKGSSYQLLSVIEKDPKIIFNIIESGLKAFGIRFNTNERFLPSQFNKIESTIEEFLQGISTEFPQIDFTTLRSWWAPVKQKPSWDFISTCNINGTKGILLVEAKSHYREMEIGGKTFLVDLTKNDNLEEIRLLVKSKFNKNSLKLTMTTQELNGLMRALNERSLLDDRLLKSFLDKLKHHDEIGNAVSEARGALSNICANISISRDNHYQLSNRIAYTWKLASMGIPTIMLYIGFINDPAWISARDHFESKQQWNDAIQSYFTEVGAEDLLHKGRIALNYGASMYFYTWALEAE